MEAKQELTAREQAYFDHVARAKEQGIPLKEYCEKLGINVRGLYAVRRVLMLKGFLPRVLAPRNAAGKKAKPGKFVGVRVAAGDTGAEAVFRVRHPSGWTVECGRFPEAAWVVALMEGAGDAAA